jgi:hypothetical protein
LIRTRQSTSIPAPEFAPVRADLARLFLAHKAELGMLDWSDEQIVAQTNDIVGALIACGIHATAHGDRAWLPAYQATSTPGPFFCPWSRFSHRPLSSDSGIEETLQ